MLRKVSAVIACLLLTLGTLSFVNLLTEDADAGYDKYKEVTWIVHYETAAGEHCFVARSVSLVPLLSDASPHRNRCHNRNNPPPPGCKEEHPHGQEIVFKQTVVSKVIVPACN